MPSRDSRRSNDRSSIKERKQFFDLVAVGLAAVLADFETLGGLDGVAFGLAVPRDQVGAVAAGFAATAAEPLVAEPGLAAGNVTGRLDGSDVVFAAVGAALVMLRRHLVHRVDLLVEHIVD